MRAVPGMYDPALLEAILPICPLPYGVDTETHRHLQVRADELRLGHKLLSDVKTADNVVVVGAGNRLSPGFLARIKHLAESTGIQEPISVLAAD